MPRLTSCVSIALLLASASAGYSQTSAPVRAGTPGGNEVLRPGDVIRVRIWREPDLSGEFPVDESGVVTVPKLGRILALGFTRDSLKQHLIASYETYLRNPSIEVALLRRISVLGAVRTPNVYAVDPTLTVSELVAMAGGATPDGKIDQVRVLRGEERLDLRLSQSTRLAETPVRSGDQLYVPQRTWLSRNLPFIVGTTLAGVGLFLGVGR